MNNHAGRTVGRRLARLAVCAVTSVAAGLTLLAVPAFASTTECGTTGFYGPVNGYSYENSSCITYDPSADSYGDTSVFTQQGATPPAGWEGAIADVYDESGDLCAASQWQYNGDGQQRKTTIAWKPAQTCGQRNYHSKGATRAWNGSGYDTYSSFRSPDLWI